MDLDGGDALARRPTEDTGESPLMVRELTPLAARGQEVAEGAARGPRAHGAVAGGGLGFAREVGQRRLV